MFCWDGKIRQKKKVGHLSSERILESHQEKQERLSWRAECRSEWEQGCGFTLFVRLPSALPRGRRAMRFCCWTTEVGFNFLLNKVPPIGWHRTATTNFLRVLDSRSAKSRCWHAPGKNAYYLHGLFFEMGSCYISQAGLELVESTGPLPPSPAK
jgi:hypothetical protein